TGRVRVRPRVRYFPLGASAAISTPHGTATASGADLARTVREKPSGRRTPGSNGNGPAPGAFGRSRHNTRGGRPPSTAPRTTLRSGYSPFQLGARFSAKAAAPSIASWLTKTGPASSFCLSHISAVDQSSEAVMISFDTRTARGPL